MYEITTLGQEIRAYRGIEGLNQEALAGKLGVDRTTVSSWERNASLPRPWHVRSLIKHGVVTKARARELIARAHKGYPVGKFRYQIRLNPPRSLLNLGVRFVLFFVRPGPNSADIWERDSINAEIDFQPISVRGTPMMIAEVRRPDDMGFQFKCFAEFRDLDWRFVRDELRTAGYKPDEHPGDGATQRLWFLFRDETQISGPEGFTDNFFYPG